ncbi:MAG: hypothetical protein LH679_07695 [Cyanobacteria bacterium CAN_BIN43]|nr:hypothetical protein [Cyanobacteria bacterium CAN_BIN43]
MIKDILTIHKAESGHWACAPSVGICGNQTLEKVIGHIEKSLSTQSDKPWDYYLWKAHGDRWDIESDRLLEECDRWHLSRYEVCTTPDESKYQAVVILYYEPATVLAIAV